MKAYEIQTYQNGRWKIDAVFDDRSLAMFEAKRMDEGNRFTGVRVVEESFDEASQKSFSRTIFRGGRAEGQIYKQRKPEPPSRRRTAPRGGSRDRNARGGPRSRQKKGGVVGPLLLFTFLIIVGLGGLFGLQQLFKLG